MGPQQDFNMRFFRPPAAAKQRPVITGRGVYITGGGRLVFVEAFDRDESGSISQARGYSISGTRAKATKQWHAWFTSGKAVAEESGVWDVSAAI